ncbi:uncharacterized protein [Antedon mediterranea]|uniref:uncharacterized protein n=1 Tax=Antedon mediterranea TaxID=105859 RepID=UPI003AF98BE3
MIELGTNMFFQNGNSIFGKLDQMSVHLADYRANVIDTEDWRLDNILEAGVKVRLYLCSKLIKVETSDGSCSDSSELPDPGLLAGPSSSFSTPESPQPLETRTPESPQPLETRTPQPLETCKPQPLETQPAGTPTVIFKTSPEDLCGIYCDRQKSCFFITCGHTICLPCATYFEETNTKECPFCKQVITTVRHLY